MAQDIGWFMSALGHLSFGLTFLSFAQSSMIKLRLIAVGSLALGLVYNSWVNWHMPAGQNIWLVIGWMTLFFAQNVYMLVTSIRRTLEVELDPKSKALLAGCFPRMHSRDWLELVSLAEKRGFASGEVLLEKGDACSALVLVVGGQVMEERGGVKRICPDASMWGELTFAMGTGFHNSSPVRIVGHRAGELYVWDYEKLEKLCAKNLRLSEALEHGFVFASGMKHGLLWTEAAEAKPASRRLMAA